MVVLSGLSRNNKEHFSKLNLMSQNKPLLIALVVVGLLLVGYLVMVLVSDDAPENVVSEPVVIPAPVAEPEPEPLPPQPEPTPEPVVVTPEPVPEPAFVLPRLDDSDALVRDGVVSLTRDEGINGWLGTNELIRKVVVLTDNVSNGSIPRQQITFLAPEAPFVAREIAGDVFLMDEDSYVRYNRVTDILASVDARRAAEFYVLLKPLFQQAFDELGYPSTKFDDIVFKAIGRMLETPVKTEPVRLVRPVVTYEYEDPKLEGLSDAQKQLLRMGPRNTRAIQSKLSEVALELRAILNE